MALLARPLALLAMTVTTAAIKVVSLDRTQDSFNDQHQGCGPAIITALPALSHFEFQVNPLFFTQTWCPHCSLWPLPAMAPLAQILALLAMAMSTMTVDVIPLDMAPDSFDDQYQGCGPAMKVALPALNRSEFQQNEEFAVVWVKAAAEWQSRGPPESPLSTDQATAIMAFTMTDPRTFNDVVHVVGRSRQEYRDNFHLKTLHFLLTDALATLRDAQKGQCREAFLKVCDTRFKTQPGETIRFGHFMPVFLSKQIGECPGETMLEVHTCHGVEIQFFSEHPEPEIVLIPPFETFKVTQYTREGDKTQIQLQSTGTYSKYNCEWLRG
ncbi:erythroblast NAD(P)(+)--arginine ADP-ribosyltransferase-like [Zonotrichia leucophrys gambelii]|uniref:erythroblast NAD(P)(+)--arginine ADP-ribosyltransferase-like n=1 Tax=Zonotrichia leucophrys gambelii TaxID=257770 RepID=UPI003140253D